MSSIDEIPNYVISTTPTSSFANSSLFGGRGPPTLLASTSNSHNHSNTSSVGGIDGATADDDAFSMVLFVLKASIMVSIVPCAAHAKISFFFSSFFFFSSIS